MGYEVWGIRYRCTARGHTQILAVKKVYIQIELYEIQIYMALVLITVCHWLCRYISIEWIHSASSSLPMFLSSMWRRVILPWTTTQTKHMIDYIRFPNKSFGPPTLQHLWRQQLTIWTDMDDLGPSVYLCFKRHSKRKFPETPGNTK